MMLPDANLLVDAVDATGPFHAAARLWWADTLLSTAEVAMCYPSISNACTPLGLGALHDSVVNERGDRLRARLQSREPTGSPAAPLGESAKHTHKGTCSAKPNRLGGHHRAISRRSTLSERGISDQARAGDVGLGDRHGSAPVERTRDGLAQARPPGRKLGHRRTLTGVRIPCRPLQIHEHPKGSGHAVSLYFDTNLTFPFSARASGRCIG